MIEERNYLLHPTYIMLGMLLAGVTALFLGFSGAYLYSRIQNNLEPLELPILFVFNTFILIIASYILIRAKQYYKSDDTKKYQISLGLALVITFVFLISQLIAWNQLYDQGIFINHSNMASYLYIISIIHFAHVIFGIPFLAIFLYHSITRMKEPVSVLVYFSDPDKERKLNLLTVYWHFIDILWVYLVIFFVLNTLF
ncbi:MAG: cytochrome c oxidase subunit III [Saprospiraceae bacterium]|nr:cytochrome c oxidase subunit 3 [Bacteroidia bacterium]NNL90645.1 cytochrome c oxidase subunit III [Saprospiraceae bacterium]